jgi:thiol-disulfide isomerase/thioredoxin
MAMQDHSLILRRLTVLSMAARSIPYLSGSISVSEMPTDLCGQNGVTGYPQMNLYHDGVFQTTYEGIRSHEVIANFIKEHTGVSDSSHSPPPPELPENDPQTPYSDRNPQGEVLALNPETFPSVVASGDVFVKFFAPWWVFHFHKSKASVDGITHFGRCGHCKKLAPTWEKLAKELQHSVTVAEVNCEDHKSFCSSEGVAGFPMLFFYPESGKKTEYTASRKLGAMKEWALRAVKP